MVEKEKSHGNADAYRGFLTHYYGKSSVFGQFLTMAHTRSSRHIFYLALVVSLLFLYTAGGATRYSFKNGAEVVLVVKSHL